MMQNNFIPQKGVNPIQMMQQFQKFKQDFYAQNGPNADPKSAFMQQATSMGMSQMDQQQVINNGSQLYNSIFNTTR